MKLSRCSGLKSGKEIGSAALIAEGHHARTDGLGSLAVLIRAWVCGPVSPLADPLIGFVITLFIFKSSGSPANLLFARLLDSVDPNVVEEIGHAAQHVPGAEGITEIRVTWASAIDFSQKSISPLLQSSLSSKVMTLPKKCAISCCITCSILPMPRFMLIPSELQESATIGSALMLTMSCRLIRIKKGYIQWNKTTVLEIILQLEG